LPMVSTSMNFKRDITHGYYQIINKICSGRE
jgi:hypothetical protein